MNAEIVYRLQRTFDEDAASTDGTQRLAPAPSSTPRVYKRLQKATLQTEIPDEVLNKLIAQLDEAWSTYKAAQDK